MHLSLFADPYASTLDQREISWPDLCAYLIAPPEYPSKDACPLLKLAAFGSTVSAKGSLRHDANVIFVSGVEGDHDAESISPQDAAALLRQAQVAGLIYTSPSHTPERPRWRVLAPLSQNYAPSARWELAARLNHIFRGTLAGESFTLSQSYYFGRVAGREYQAHVVEGYYLDTLALPALYPAARPNANGDFALTDGPVPEWRGPTDDDDLIRRALQSKSAAGAFGGRASFADLWEANVDVLSQVYPPSKASEPYNASVADAALASHLAFWTGRDGERIQRLMLRSGLVRDKWERDDYLPRTITEMLARPGEVLQDKPMEEAATLKAAAGAPMQSDVTGQTFLSPEAQKELFIGCVYVQDRHRVLVPGGALLKPDQFRVAYGGYVFAMDLVNERTTRNAWEAFTESQSLRAPRADTICFKPDRGAGEIVQQVGETAVNIFWPVQVPRKQGEASRFTQHLAKLLPDANDREILLCYMAACVQHQGHKFQWAPLIQGAPGNGKSLISRCVAEAIGRRYTHWPKASKLAAQFNGWMVGKTFYAVEDIHVPGAKMEIIEELKPMITGGDGLEIESKGIDQVSTDICGNFIFNCNSQSDLPKTNDDRRYAVFHCAQQSAADILRDGMGGEYFPRLYAWLREEGYAIVSELLWTYPIAPRLNPAVTAGGYLHRAPETSSTAAAIQASRGGVEQQIAEVIAQDTPGFMGGWVSSVMLDRFVSEVLRMGARLSLTKRRELLQGMGYVLHPGLPEGRTNNPVQPDGKKPQLYILAHHPDRYLTGAAEIAKAYTAAQQTG